MTTHEKLSYIMVGDKVTRMLGGEIPMFLIVTDIDEKFIYCGMWKFSNETGAEVDEELGWDGITKTGSHIQV